MMEILLGMWSQQYIEKNISTLIVWQWKSVELLLELKDKKYIFFALSLQIKDLS